MKYLIPLFLALQAIPSSSEAFKDSTFGCLNKEDMFRIFRMADGATLLFNLIESGDCKQFKENDQVMIESNNSDGACVIPMDGTSCFWVVPVFLKP